MTERASFEAWAKLRLFNLRRMKDFPDQYLDLSTECGWQAWQTVHETQDALLSRVALDIAKWFVNGDRPDEWKLKEWAESLDRDAISKAYEDRATGAKP